MSPDDKIREALVSYQNLTHSLHTLTENEVLAALELESSTRRRRAVLCRLLRKAIRLNEIRYRQKLVEEYLDGEKQICNFNWE